MCVCVNPLHVTALQSKVPRAALRTDLLLFKTTFTVLDQAQSSRISLCEAGLSALKHSTGLKKVLEIVLALGNYMNGGTKKGGQYGFKMSTINKLSGSKNAAGDGTLLDFIFMTMERNYPNELNFYKELKMLTEASNYEFSFMQSEASKFNGMLSKLEGELKATQNLPPDQDLFYTIMSRFYNQVKSKGEEYEKRVKAIGELTTELALFFGEEKKMKMEEMFALFGSFVDEFKNVVDETTAARKAAEAEDRRLEAEAKAKEERAAKRDAARAAEGAASPETSADRVLPSPAPGVARSKDHKAQEKVSNYDQAISAANDPTMSLLLRCFALDFFCTSLSCMHSLCVWYHGVQAAS
jgi:hypothetical protein